uniref:One cut domain family member n=1 Tax=Plectus sambesii TaxID=2011161 RepID=A0A914V7N3_9BILA
MKLEPPAAATTSRANDSSPSSNSQQQQLITATTSSTGIAIKNSHKSSDPVASSLSSTMTDSMDKVRRIDDTVERVVASLSSSSRASLEQQLTGDDPTGGDFLHVNANLSFNSSNRSVVFEDLPENFLENISPQQGSSVGLGVDQQHNSGSPMLASLAPMSLQGVDGGGQTSSSGYVTLVPMATPTYVTSLKMELPPGGGEQSTSTQGPASGLLPPLHLSDLAPGTQVLLQQNGGGAQPHFIKLELASQSQHNNSNTADTPPAVSTVELANNLIASMLSGDQQQQHLGNTTVVLQSGTQPRRLAAGSGPPLAGPRAVYSTKDTSDPLNAEIDEDIYIDTKDLCKRIAYELKQHSIPQAIFAERILCRSQGTLSDLLRNPKPWNKLKSGRETFRRMYNWVQQPLPQRLAILDLWKETDEQQLANQVPPANGTHMQSCSTVTSAPRPPQQQQQQQQQMQQQQQTQSVSGGGGGGGGAKRPRLVFTDIQKRTLQAIFKETQRPSREMQQTIAEHLRLDLSTVANFFMNARRRSRSGPLNPDEPAPYQQVRPITPPPDSPPPRSYASRPRAAKSGAAPALMPHIEDTVAHVAEQAAQYARRRPITATAMVSSAPSAGEPAIKVARIDDESIGDDEDGMASLVAVPTKVDSIYVVVSTDSGATQRRSLPVMSLGKTKTVTVKLEREVPATASSIANSNSASSVIDNPPAATVEVSSTE